MRHRRAVTIQLARNKTQAVQVAFEPHRRAGIFTQRNHGGDFHDLPRNFSLDGGLSLATSRRVRGLTNNGKDGVGNVSQTGLVMWAAKSPRPFYNVAGATLTPPEGPPAEYSHGGGMDGHQGRGGVLANPTTAAPRPCLFSSNT